MLKKIGFVFNLLLIGLVFFVAGYNYHIFEVDYAEKKLNQRLFPHTEKPQTEAVVPAITNIPIQIASYTPNKIVMTIADQEQKKGQSAETLTDTEKASEDSERKVEDTDLSPVNYTILKGDIISAIVSKDRIDVFFERNNIDDPTNIKQGTRVTLMLPKEIIDSGNYRSDFKIFTKTEETGELSHTLMRCTVVDKDKSLLDHLLAKSRSSFTSITLPYINLTDYMLSDPYITSLHLLPKIETACFAQNEIELKTIHIPIEFSDNTYFGFKSFDYFTFDENVNQIKQIIDKYIKALKDTKSPKRLFTFLVFGETLIQVDYIRKKNSENNQENYIATLGIIHESQDTEMLTKTIATLITTGRIKGKALAEIRSDNLTRFFH